MPMLQRFKRSCQYVIPYLLALLTFLDVTRSLLDPVLGPIGDTQLISLGPHSSLAEPGTGLAIGLGCQSANLKAKIVDVS